MVKNLTPSSSNVAVYPSLQSSPQVFTEQANNPGSPIHISNPLGQLQHIESYKDSKDMNLVSSSARKEETKLEVGL